MMIRGIQPYGQINNVYLYGNAHFNQTQNSAVPPVRPVHSVTPLDEQADNLKVAVTYRNSENSTINEDQIALREKNNLAENYQSQQRAISYDTSNPYEMARKNIESSLLSGMNFDMLA